MVVEKKIKPCQSPTLHLQDPRLNHASGTLSAEYELSSYQTFQTACAHCIAIMIKLLTWLKTLAAHVLIYLKTY